MVVDVETGLNIAQVGLELLVLLSLPPKYWDYKHVAPLMVLTQNF